MDCAKIGELIRRLRREKGYTQRALAAEIGVSDKAVSKWERGLGCPDVSLLGALSAKLGVNLEELLAGELVLIPREQFHQFVVGHPEEYVRCIVGFHRTPRTRALIDEVMTCVDVIEAPPKSVRALLETMMEIAKSDLREDEKAAFLQNLPLQLLLALKLCTDGSRQDHASLSSPIESAMSYIDRHLSETLTVERIAQALHMSPSSLAHRFRTELNIPVYRYVTEKRFSAVRQRVAQGEGLASAAEACGFKDYSGFFRLYKKHYGTSPSKAGKGSFSP